MRASSIGHLTGVQLPYGIHLVGVRRACGSRRMYVSRTCALDRVEILIRHTLIAHMSYGRSDLALTAKLTQTVLIALRIALLFYASVRDGQHTSILKP